MFISGAPIAAVDCVVAVISWSAWTIAAHVRIAQTIRSLTAENSNSLAKLVKDDSGLILLS